MRQTLLSTKLNIPASSQPLLRRARLTDTLARARTHRVTLVSAPPGYGKTTLVSSWLSETNIPHAWLSLDEGDNDPTRFLEYFLTALHQVVPGIRLEMMDLLKGSQGGSFQTLMAVLINEAAGAGDFFIVLDDFHVLRSAPILDMLGYLLEHLPPVVHIMLLSRNDPTLPVSRLRARSHLLEIRAEQLRFSTDEIARFFDQVMRLALDAADVLALETRTEGWIAGLQLAGLAIRNVSGPSGSSMQAEDAHGFITAFTGSHAYIMDYLTEEVLRSQPEATRAFLLQTAILDRMCGSLCEAVIGNGAAEAIDGQMMLEAAERNHLFVIPLDTGRRWYRYHHLFKEVLARRLEVVYPGLNPGLHRRASEWFEQHGLVHEAIYHAMQAGDSDRTARLVEQHGCDVLMGGELVTLAGWLAAVEPYTRTRPWLAMQKAWVFALSGQVEQAELAISAGEQLIGGLEPTNEIRTLQGSFAATRAHCANIQGNPGLAAQYARQAVDLLSVGGDFSCALRSLAMSLLGDASWVQGKMDEARQAYVDAVQIGQISGNAHMTMLSNTRLADVYFEQGKLHQAARLYAETLRMAEQADGSGSSYAQGIHFGLGRVYFAWNRLEEAAAANEACLRLCRQWGSISLQAACLALAAQIHNARGDHQKAREAANASEALIQEHTLSPSWLMWSTAGLAQFWLAHGRSEKASLLIHDAGVLPETFSLETASKAGLSPDAPIPYRLEPAFLALARLLLAQENPDAALGICERLFSEAKSGEREGTVAQLLILQALAYHAKKDLSSALAALESAVAMARPEQAVRLFLDEGERMAKLLYLAKVHHVGGEFVDGLLAYFGLPSALEQATGIEPSPTQPVHDLLVEPLSAREMEVLRAIAEGCSNQEIANRFVLSPKTVKRHISNIYGKLDAKNRTQAVALARSLKLIK